MTEPYYGFSEINIDSEQEYELDQLGVGKEEGEFILMTRSIEDLLECERTPAQKKLAYREKDYRWD